MFEGPLSCDTSNGRKDPSRFTIKFALSAETRGNADADKLQAADAVHKAAGIVGELGPAPQLVGLADSAINTGTNVVAKLQTFENTWGPLLQRIALFNKIVAGVATVLDVEQSRPLSV